MKKESVDFLGGDKVIANLGLYEENMSRLAAEAMQAVGNKVILEAVQLTPIQTGELRSRSFTEGPLYDKESGMWKEVIGYEKENSGIKKKNLYAIYVHERTGLHHHVGQAKFLEDPVKAESATYLQDIAKVLTKLVKLQ